MIEKRLQFAIVVACALAVFFGASSVAQAQGDDWEVEADGEDREQQIIERYREMLEENPVEGMALERLLGHVGHGAGLDQLVDQYERRVEDSPERLNLRLILGHLYKARGDYEEALEEYDRAVELDREDATAWLSRGTVRLLLGDRTEATRDFEEALERETDSGRRREILRDLGELAFSERQFEQGKEFFNRLIEQAPRDRQVRMEYVQLLVQYRQLDEAIQQYEALRRFVADDPRRLANLLRDKADVHEMRGELDVALDTYEEALGLVRAESWIAREVRSRIVEVYRQGGRLDEFLDEYGGQWADGGVEQRMMVADVHAELGQLEEALEQYRQLSTPTRAPVEGRDRTIRMLERLGRDEEIAGIYRELMEVEPSRAEHGFELADHHMRMGDREAAGGVLEQLERRFSNDSYVLLDIADAYARWNFDEAAERAYEEVLEREEDDSAVLIAVGDFYFQRGRRGRALEVWSKLPDSALGETEGTRRMAELFIERGVMGRGIAAYERLLEDDPENERLLRSMARALERASRFSEALQRWERVLEVTDSSRARREARSRMVDIYDRRQELRAEMRDWREIFDQEDGDQAIEAGLFLVEAHLSRHDYEEAEQVLDGLEERELSERQRTTALILLEQTYVQSGRHGEAIEVLERLAELQPDRRNQLMERQADYALELQDGQRAVDYASRAIETNPDSARAHRKLAQVYERVDNLEAAARHFRTAVEIDPRAHDARLELAEVLRDLDRIAEAREALMTVVEEARESQLIRDAGERLLAMARERGRLEALEREWSPLVMRMPIQQAHARLMFDLYDSLAGPILMQAYHGGRVERRRADEQLFAMGGRAATLLVQQLQREDTASKARALRMIAEMEVGVASAQVGRLIGAENDDLQKMAVVAAARLGDPEFVEPLEEAMSSGSATVRHLATWALGEIDTPGAHRVLADLADGDVDGTGPRLALRGIGRAGTDDEHRLVGRELERLVEQPETVDRNRAAVALMVAANAIASGDGASYRGSLERLAASRTDRIGTWASRVLGNFGDADAAAALWELALAEDERLAQQAERGLVQLLGGPVQMETSWRGDVRYYDWVDGEFDARRLLRDTERRWNGRGAERTESDWAPAVGEGLREVFRRGTAGNLDAALDRMAAEIDEENASSFWSEQRAGRFAESVLEVAPEDALDEATLTALTVLRDGAGERFAQLGVEEVLEREVLLSFALASSENEAAIRPLLVEAMGRATPEVRRRALAGIRRLESPGDADPELAGLVVEALRDDDETVQIAAVRTVGDLRLEDARETLIELERRARPALRRAVRRAMRSLDSGG